MSLSLPFYPEPACLRFGSQASAVHHGVLENEADRRHWGRGVPSVYHGDSVSSDCSLQILVTMAAVNLFQHWVMTYVSNQGPSGWW